MKRVIVIGTTGSGKTTFARALAAKLGVPHVEMDRLNWGPNWTEYPLEEFRRRVADFVAQDAWVMDGNYGKARDLAWPRADTLIWLDYPQALVFWRLLRRTVRRSFSGEELWSGNRETLGKAFLSKESILAWFFKTRGTHRRRNPALFAAHPHLRVLRFRSPREARRWLQGDPPFGALRAHPRPLSLGGEG